MYHSAEPVMRWCKQNESFLVNRNPVANVGVLWSQRNTDFYGRDHAADRVDAPYTGWMHALVRARIPYLPVHADDLDRAKFNLLILPGVGGLSNTQCNSIRRFVEQGGSLLATGDSTLYDEWGDPRPDYALADLFGAHRISETPRLSNRVSSADVHTYLRLETPKHPVLKGFDETETIPYGGILTALKVDPAATVPLTYIPPFPTYPPETSWMREPKTDIPGLILSTKGKSRIAFLPADLDRRYTREHLPDHANLLANTVRWALNDELPLHIEGPGLIDCHLYRQGPRLILHLVNLTSAATWRAPLEELIPIGPFEVHVSVPKPVAARFLVSNAKPQVRMQQGRATITVPRILDHEVIVFE